MTRIVWRKMGVVVLSVLVAAVFLAEPVAAADRAAERGRVARAWSEIWRQAVFAFGAFGVELGPIEEILPKKGAGIDPNGALLKEYTEPLPAKKGAGIDPNG